MSENKYRFTDWDEVALTIGIFILIILCAGDPDLLDAIIAWVGRQ